MKLETPVRLALDVSVTVIVAFPLVPMVAEKLPVPEVRGEFPGRCASGSELENLTVPEYVVTVSPLESIAVTVNWIGEPMTAVPGVESINDAT
jgi:hypothetical protein